MRSLLQKLFLVLSLVFILIPRDVWAMANIMPLEQVKSGMTGVGYTVIDTSGAIEPFNVDIVGLTNGGKGTSAMIMARASGELIDKTGGVLQGMSGSPIYVDGKLIGALAIGLKEMSPYTFFITPIENMTRIWNLPDKRAEDKVATIPVKKSDEKIDNDQFKDKLKEIFGKKVDDEKLSDDEEKISDDEKLSDEEKVSDDEEKIFMLFSGFDSNGLNFLKKELSPLGFKNFYAAPAAGSATSIKYGAKLEPGSPVGAAIVCGDFTVGATGTVTAVDNDKILGFGHAFVHGGNVNYFLMDASVLGPISGANGSGIRMASVGDVIGRINQDRDAGISGIIGNFPNVVPITINVKNNSQNTNETYHASIAYNENILPKIGATVVYSALSKSVDSLAEATVAVNFDINTNVTESGVMSRKNIFFSDSDVGQVAITELLQALNLICANTTAESDIFDISVDLEIDEARKTASIISAVPDKKIVKPGETVNFTVTIQPYRSEQEKITIPYTVPFTIPEGKLILDVHSGALVPVTQTNAGVVTPSTETPDKEYRKKINNFLNLGRNNQIIIQPSANQPKHSKKEIEQTLKRAFDFQNSVPSAKKRKISATQKYDADYIIDNVIQVSVNVGKLQMP
ncbi:MAG: SpoIVB peptidase S55 domain protein [Selenomonadaceae bacterium]|nr:SpoIVB peptidase S55 domain protein [Selenomonadaceae bacterium]